MLSPARALHPSPSKVAADTDDHSFSTFRLFEACTVQRDRKKRKLRKSSTASTPSDLSSKTADKLADDSVELSEDEKTAMIDEAEEEEEMRSPEPSPNLATTTTYDGIPPQQLEERLAALTRNALQGDAEVQGVFAEDGDSTPESHSPHPRLPVDDVDRMQRLNAEFGTSTYLPGEEECFLAEAQGLAVAEVLIKGRLFLTNHRLFFYALLPHLEADSNKNNVIKSGVVYKYRTGKEKGPLPGHGAKMKFYGQLTRDTLSIYRSANDLLSPVGVMSLNDIVDVPPVEPGSDMLVFTFIRRDASGKSRIERSEGYGTPEEVISWQRELSHALWAFRNTRDRYRASIPLDRIVSAERSDFLRFSTVTTFEIDVGEGETRTIRFGVPPTELPFWDKFDAALAHVRSIVDVGRPISNPPEVNVLPPNSAPANPRRESSESTPSSGDHDHDHDHDDVEASAAKVERRIGRLCQAFNLSRLEIRSVYHAELSRLLYNATGVLGIGEQGVFFYARRPTGDVKVRISAHDIREAKPASSIRFSTFGLRLLVRGHDDINFDFHDRTKRDRAIADIEALVEASPTVAGPTSATTPLRESPFGMIGRTPKRSETLSGQAMDDWIVESPVTPLDVPPCATSMMPLAVNFEMGDVLAPKMKVCCMTIGSRGDVQPYIALCQRMILVGMKPVIATHSEYKDWVESFGIEHRSIGGDPGLLMQVSVEHKIFSIDTVKKFSKWFEELLRECYVASEGVDVIVESPSTFAGLHVAEARKIPYFRAFTMPFTRTRAFPHAFMSGPTDTNGSYNYSSYILYEQIIWKASGGMTNKFRKEIGLPPTDLEHMRQREIPFIYNFSSSVVPRPMDWPAHVVISGYWFLETDLSKWSPPAELVAFLDGARQAGKPIVYIGFGSITVSNPAELTRNIIEAVETAGVACVLAKGWSGRMAKSGEESEEPKMPASIYQLSAVPHDWLFDRVDAAMHHGGAGTTAASLRAGLPTLIKPFFGDQFFWARIVTNNGSGMRVHSLSAKDMADAITHATSDRIMREKAQQIGEKLRAEDGVGRACKAIAQWYPRAATLAGATLRDNCANQDHLTPSSSKTASSPAVSTPVKPSPLSSPVASPALDKSHDQHHRHASFSLPKLASLKLH